VPDDDEQITAEESDALRRLIRPYGRRSDVFLLGLCCVAIVVAGWYVMRADWLGTVVYVALAVVLFGRGRI